MDNNSLNVDWNRLKARHEAWWAGENTDGPVLSVLASKEKGGADRATDRWIESSSGSGAAESKPKADESGTESDEAYWTDFETVLNRSLNAINRAYYTGDSFPRLFANLGVASLAVFLGAKPKFTRETIWYQHIYDDATAVNIELDKNNAWLRLSLELTRRLREAERGRFKTGIPDLTENLDVLSCLFDGQQLLFELYDNEADVHRLLEQTQKAWFEAYDLHHELLCEDDGFCCYGPFGLLGKGKLAKLQCDVSGMISQDMFCEFVLPYLTQQTERLDKSLYHLDGVDALKHLDALLGISSLTALQWTPGAGKPDGGSEEWDYVYEKALTAGKSIYALVAPENIKRFVRRFGSKGVFIVTSAGDAKAADELIATVKTLV